MLIWRIDLLPVRAYYLHTPGGCNTPGLTKPLQAQAYLKYAREPPELGVPPLGIN